MYYQRYRRRIAMWIPIAAVISLAVGVAAGMLFAPKEGRASRRYLLDKSVEIRDRAKDTVSSRMPFRHDTG